jgi:hypothetical protein
MATEDNCVLRCNTTYAYRLLHAFLGTWSPHLQSRRTEVKVEGSPEMLQPFCWAFWHHISEDSRLIIQKLLRAKYSPKLFIHCELFLLIRTRRKSKFIRCLVSSQILSMWVFLSFAGLHFATHKLLSIVWQTCTQYCHVTCCRCCVFHRHQNRVAAHCIIYWQPCSSFNL